MKSLGTAIWAEWKKVRRSAILYITIFLFAFIPSMMGLMIYLVRNPVLAKKLGILSAKASMFGEADWPSFLGMLQQSVASIGLIGFGFVTAWVFGREYTEKTLKDILALPISRGRIVTAKLVIAIGWSLLLALVLWIAGLVTGYITGLQGFTEGLLQEGALKYLITTSLTLLLCSPVAFFAGYGKGIITPLGFVILTLILSQLLAVAGLGAYFPWAVPGLFTAPPDAEGMELYGISYILIGSTFILGYLGTILWWQRADHH